MWPFDIARRRAIHHFEQQTRFLRRERWMPMWLVLPHPAYPVELMRLDKDNTVFVVPADLPGDTNVAGLYWRYPAGSVPVQQENLQ